jgi:ferredoxin
MAWTVIVEDCNEAYRCSGEQTVLRGMENLGKKGIPVGCRQGGCGVCKVEVVEGQYRKRVMSRAKVSAEEEAANQVLACCIWPESDLRVRVLGKMRVAVMRPGQSLLQAIAEQQQAQLKPGG